MHVLYDAVVICLNMSLLLMTLHIITMPLYILYVTATVLIDGVVYDMKPYMSMYCQVNHCSIINYYLFLYTV